MKYWKSHVLAAVLLLPTLSLAQQNTQMLELMQQLTRLESEVRQLRGELERLNHQNQRLKNQQADVYLELDRRLRVLETGLAGPGAATGPGAVAGTDVVTGTQGGPGLQVQPAPDSQAAVAGDTPVIDQAPGAATTDMLSGGATADAGTTDAGVPATGQPVTAVDPAQEKAAYKAAFQLLKTGKYEESIAAFNSFIQTYPGSEFTVDAYYWLGEANYYIRQHELALQSFNKVVSQYPDYKKLPKALLKIGYIHYELKALEQARQVLTDLTQKYPGTTEATLADNRLKRMKLESR